MSLTVVGPHFHGSMGKPGEPLTSIKELQLVQVSMRFTTDYLGYLALIEEVYPTKLNPSREKSILQILFEGGSMVKWLEALTCILEAH